MRRALPLAVLLTVLCFAGVAHAEFYLGASYLTTDAEIEEAFENFDTDDSAYKFFAGFTIGYLGYEWTTRNELGGHHNVLFRDTADRPRVGDRSAGRRSRKPTRHGSA